MTMDAVDAYLAKQAPAFEAAWCDLLRIPSVSADSRHKADCRRAAEQVRRALAG